MIMYARARCVLTAFLVLLFSMSIALAEQNAPQQGRTAFSQQELDQMLAPIALYPDALLSQILMAATYPVEVVEAARWSRRNSDLAGDRAVRAAERMDWDPSVKSLVAFPQILGMLDEKLNWTEDLGDAFLDQQAQVMDTVQYLRQKAYAAGNLTSSDQFRVDYEGSTFVISLANPEIVYLPYYNPTVVYGTWWWATYQPVYWAPWPGYYSRPGYARGFAWGPGIPVARGFFFGAPDWHRRSVNIVNVNTYYYHPVQVNRQTEIARNTSVALGASNAWQHDMTHRRDVPYRDASSRQQSGHPGAAPATVSRPNIEQRTNPATAPDGGARNPEGRSPTARGHDASPVEGRGWSGNRPDGRVDSGSRIEERGQHVVASLGEVQNAGRGSGSTNPPAVVNVPNARSAPGQSVAPSALPRPNAGPQPNVANTAAGSGRRAEQRNAGARERSGNQATAPGDSSVAASSPASSTSAAQVAGNSRGSGGNSRHPQ
jgi:Protein of unknown function (DUF3300)